MISVIMPNYNKAEYLAEAIESVIGQTYKDWELIIVDDCSTDSSEELLDWYNSKDKRIRVYYNPRNIGIARTRNKGLSMAKGEYIAVMDSDDIMNPKRLAKSLKAIKGYDYVFGPYLQADSRGQVQGAYDPPKKPKDHILDGDTPHVTIMAKRACFVSSPYRLDLDVNDDSGLCLDWYKEGFRGKKVNEALMIVRYHNNSVSVKKQKRANKILKALQSELDEYLES